MIKQEGFKLGIWTTLLVIILSAVLFAPALAAQQSQLIVTADTLQANAVDTKSSATSAKPAAPKTPSTSGKPTNSSKPSASAASYPISGEEAIRFVRENLSADETWTVDYSAIGTYADNDVYFIVLTSPQGDSYLRLVNAKTGEITVLSLWAYFSGDNKILSESKPGRLNTSKGTEDNRYTNQDEGDDEGDEEDDT